MKTPNNIIAIWGVPRSGTTWLGQIFNSSPNTLFRYQPLFSYAFKNYISNISTLEEIISFLDGITETKDDFILHGLADRQERNYLDFDKAESPTHLVMKHVRYHNIIENLLKKINNIKIIGIIRHPCATINSWIRADKEFNPAWNPLEEWQFAEKKNMQKAEEYYGFEKWKEAVLNFVALQQKYPDNVYLLKYEELNHAPLYVIKDIFSFSCLQLETQTINFINRSTSELGGTYSVFRKKCGDNTWKHQLSPLIIEKIYQDLTGTEFEEYLNE